MPESMGGYVVLLSVANVSDVIVRCFGFDIVGDGGIGGCSCNNRG